MPLFLISSFVPASKRKSHCLLFSPMLRRKLTLTLKTFAIIITYKLQIGKKGNEGKGGLEEGLRSLFFFCSSMIEDLEVLRRLYFTQAQREVRRLSLERRNAPEALLTIEYQLQKEVEEKLKQYTSNPELERKARRDAYMSSLGESQSRLIEVFCPCCKHLDVQGKEPVCTLHGAAWLTKRTCTDFKDARVTPGDPHKKDALLEFQVANELLGKLDAEEYSV